MKNFFRKRRKPELPRVDEEATVPRLPPIGGVVLGMDRVARDVRPVFGEPERNGTDGEESVFPWDEPMRGSLKERIDDRSGSEALPRFTLPVAGEPGGGGTLGGGATGLSGALREAFTPTRPKQRVNSLFVGRLNTLKRIIAAVEEQRAHVVLFGDRGRGKTSLANAVRQIASDHGYLTLKLTCSAELSFEDVFRHFLRKIPATCYRLSLDSSTPGGPTPNGRSFTDFSELLPAGRFSVTELNEVLTLIEGSQVLLILDEYDRVTDDDLRNKLAELIKNLTDSDVPVTLFIVGVAQDLDQLLGKHPSIQRSLVPVHLPLMTDREVERIMQVGAENAGIAFSPEVRRRIVLLAKGLPYFAQLLSHHAARHAVSRGSTEVAGHDLAHAVALCLREAERSIVEAYNQVLGAEDRKAAFQDVLFVAAQCRMDEYGAFHPDDMAQVPVRRGEPLMPLSLQYPLEQLSDETAGSVPILQKVVEAGGCRYRFTNQMMRQYVLMRQANERGLL